MKYLQLIVGSNLVLMVPWPLPQKIKESFNELIGAAIWNFVSTYELKPGLERCFDLRVRINE